MVISLFSSHTLKQNQNKKIPPWTNTFILKANHSRPTSHPPALHQLKAPNQQLKPIPNLLGIRPSQKRYLVFGVYIQSSAITPYDESTGYYSKIFFDLIVGLGWVDLRVWFGCVFEWAFVFSAKKTREKLNKMFDWWDVNGLCCKCQSSFA